MGKKIIVEGTITKGMGEGAFFMSMPHYKSEINKKLGFDAFPGTLNIKINPKNLDALKKLKPVLIDGFASGTKKFGGARCYKSSISNIKGAIIIPDINKHGKDIIEFIAPVHIKSALKVKDGDKIRVELK